MTSILLRKTLRDHAKPLLWWSAALLSTFALELWAYPATQQATSELHAIVDAYPDAMRKMLRIDDYTSGTGFLKGEMFSMMVQFVFIAIGAAFGAGATAAEEERGTADALLTLPVSRRRILAVKMLALPLAYLALMAVTVLLLAAGMPWFGLEASLGNITIALVAAALLGMHCAGFAYLVGVHAGKRPVASGAAVGVAVASFMIYGLAPVSTAFETLNRFAPWEWAFGGDPLRNGADLPRYGVLVGTTMVLYGLAFRAFDRRDIAI